MPTFYSDDFDIDPSEFIDNCDDSEIKQLIEILVEAGYIDAPESIGEESNLPDKTYKEALNKLQDKRVYLTLEEEQFLLNLANKF